MKIIQLLPTLAYGDAIGNETFALDRYLKEKGYSTGIYAESILLPLKSDIAYPIDSMPHLQADDIAIYHLSTGSELTDKFARLTCKKVVLYHNITPPCFFEGYNDTARRTSKWGISGARFLADKVDFCIADSDYNRQELIQMGYQCPIEVMPILMEFSDYKREADQAIIKQYKDGKPNILFTGRVAPNKNFEDMIRAFSCYKNNYEPLARLFFVGNPQSIPAYYEMLQDYIREIGLRDVYFTGHIKFNQILAYYQIANLFLCLSKHEGFCVPLVESMYFDVPILAGASTAVPETLDGSGVLLEHPEPLAVAGMMNRLVKDSQLRESVLHNQRLRLQALSYETVSNRFGTILKKIAGA